MSRFHIMKDLFNHSNVIETSIVREKLIVMASTYKKFNNSMGQFVSSCKRHSLWDKASSTSWHYYYFLVYLLLNLNPLIFLHAQQQYHELFQEYLDEMVTDLF